MKKILVPIDFSSTSRTAEEYAILFAKDMDAEVHLLHVYRELLPPTVGPEPWTITASKTEEKVSAYLDKEIEFLEDKYGVEIKGDIMNGSKADSIMYKAIEINADFIVMTVKGDKKAKLFGNTVLKMIRRIDTPVLIIPKGIKYKPFKNIVLAIDFDELANSSYFDPLLAIARKYDSSLRVVHVESKGADVKAYELPGKLRMGEALAKFDYTYDKVEYNDVIQGIEDFVQAHPADILTVLAHHHGAFERLFGLPHTPSLSFELKIPLLVLKGTSNY